MLYLSLLQTSHACINERPTIVKEKNWVFVVDGVGFSLIYFLLKSSQLQCISFCGFLKKLLLHHERDSLISN